MTSRLRRLRLCGAAPIILSAVVLSTGCLHRHRAPVGRRLPPPSPPSATAAPSAPPAPIVQGEEGLASWYGHPYHGRPTANGEIYNMYGMTAAHRTLPFGTRVRVQDLDNGLAVDVRINDRGPFVEGRIIDLSYAAAQAIHIEGIARVRLQLLSLGPETGPQGQPAIYAVQVGAFKNKSNADRLKARIEQQFGPVNLYGFDRGDGFFYRVRVGHESTEDGAVQLAHNLQAAGLATVTFVVRLN